MLRVLVFSLLCFLCSCVTYFYREPPPETATIYRSELERWNSLVLGHCMLDTERLSNDYFWIYDIGGVVRLPCGLGPAGPVYLKSGEVWLNARPSVIMLNASTFLSLLTGPKEEDKKETKKTPKENVTSSTAEIYEEYKPVFGPKTEKCAENSTLPECSEFLDKNEKMTNETVVKKKTKKENEKNWCLIVNFYSPYCPFSAQLGPGFNALPRVFPRLHVVAVDATESSRLNNRFGIAGTPSVLLWHNGKVIGRYDHTDYLFETLKQFITKTLDLDPEPGSGIFESDLKGPLPTEPVKFTDYYLILCWLFITGSLLYYGSKTTPVIRVFNYLNKVWSEAREANERIAPENIVRPSEPITESDDSGDDISVRNEPIATTSNANNTNTNAADDSSQNSSSVEHSPVLNSFSLRHRRNYSDQSFSSSNSNDET